jgi:predicted porin
MIKLVVSACLLQGGVLFLSHAGAQPFDIESEIEASTVFSALSDNGTEAEDLLYEISLDTRFETIRQDGTEIGGRLTLRGQRDHPSRPGFAGAFGGSPGPAGGFSGLSGDLKPEATGARGRLEAAYLEMDGGYGELRLGKDRGIAARFHEGAPSALLLTGTANPYLDPTGLKIIRTNHDLTGPSAKLSYATPRILGLRAGVSVTPDPDGAHLDRSLSSLPSQPDLNGAVEVGANLSRTLRSSRTRIRASLAWSTADLSGPLPHQRDRVSTLSAGANVETSGFEFGASWLKSDNGFQTADYEAWEVGLGRSFGETKVSIGYGEANDALAGISSRSITVAAARELTDGLGVAISYQDEEVETLLDDRSSSGIVVEITLSAGFFGMSAN